MRNLLRSAILLLPAVILIFSCSKNHDSVSPSNTDSVTVTVVNGYGSGKYKVGDTVHIFTSHYTDTQLFDKWSGDDAALLDAPDEWHTWFVMPAKNVTVTGNVKTVGSIALQLEQIQGKDRLKPVYYYFPANHKGVVYLLHGTNGKAAYVASDYEFRQLIKDLVSNSLGVIITEAEEATTSVDANADGKLRWALVPYDTVASIDYVNIRMISESFYSRAITTRAKLKFSVGMSDGGFYSAALSSIYKYKAGVNYCSQGSLSVIQSTVTPIQFCMAKFDNNSSVGSKGNADAQSYSNSLNSRGVCSKYFIKQRSPIYPERFARRGDISTTLSVSLFNELKSKGYIDSRKYYIGFSDQLMSAYQSNPSNFPIMFSLTATQRSFMFDQIDLSVADHKMYSDFNRATVKFINTQCQ